MAVALTQLNPLDWIILAALAMLLLLGSVRGFGPTLNSMLTWGCSFVAAQIMSGVIGGYFLEYVGGYDRVMLNFLPFAVCFLLFMIIFRLLFFFLVISRKTTPLSRTFGALLALPLAALQLLILTIFARILGFDSNPYWLDSQLLPLILYLESYWETYVFAYICGVLPAAYCVT